MDRRTWIITSMTSWLSVVVSTYSHYQSLMVPITWNRQLRMCSGCTLERRFFSQSARFGSWGKASFLTSSLRVGVWPFVVERAFCLRGYLSHSLFFSDPNMYISFIPSPRSMLESRRSFGHGRRCWEDVSGYFCINTQAHEIFPSRLLH